MEPFLKIYLPLFFTSFIILVFIVPSVRVYRQTRINPFRFATNNNEAHDFIGFSMKILILLLFVTTVTYSISPFVYSYFSPFYYLNNRLIQGAGLIVAHASAIGIMVAQYQMKQSWRIGIDYENKTRLVTTGLFAMSRNPIYLFLLFGLIGFFLVIPNAVTFAVLVAAFLVLNVTMRLEEDFLLKQHGADYTEYKQRVRRLL